MVLVYKIMMFVLMFAILFVLKDVGSIIKAFVNKTQIQLGKYHMLWLGLSLSYILTIIFSGLKF